MVAATQIGFQTRPENRGFYIVPKIVEVNPNPTVEEVKRLLTLDTKYIPIDTKAELIKELAISINIDNSKVREVVSLLFDAKFSQEERNEICKIVLDDPYVGIELKNILMQFGIRDQIENHPNQEIKDNITKTMARFQEAYEKNPEAREFVEVDISEDLVHSFYSVVIPQMPESERKTLEKERDKVLKVFKTIGGLKISFQNPRSFFHGDMFKTAQMRTDFFKKHGWKYTPAVADYDVDFSDVISNFVVIKDYNSNVLGTSRLSYAPKIPGDLNNYIQEDSFENSEALLRSLPFLFSNYIDTDKDVDNSGSSVQEFVRSNRWPEVLEELLDGNVCETQRFIIPDGDYIESLYPNGKLNRIDSTVLRIFMARLLMGGTFALMKVNGTKVAFDQADPEFSEGTLAKILGTEGDNPGFVNVGSVQMSDTDGKVEKVWNNFIYPNEGIEYAKKGAAPFASELAMLFYHNLVQDNFAALNQNLLQEQ